MAEPQDPSYYEIALTHRQVLFGFVILLGCLAAAFFAGVWMGRGDEVALAAAEPANQEVAQAATSSLPEVNFFSEKEGVPAPATAKSVAPAAKGQAAMGQTAKVRAKGTTPVQLTPEAKKRRRERIRKSREEEARRAAQAREAEAKSSSPPAATPKPAPPRAATVARAQPKPAPTKPAPSSSSSSSSPSSSSVAERFVIQVLSTRERAKAEDVVQRLKAAGYATLMSTLEQDSQVMYRVRLGPYPNRAEADRVANKVRHGFKLDTWVTTE